jgi:hypothetical protein
MAVDTKAKLNTGEPNEAFTIISEAMHGQVLNNLRQLPKTSPTFDAEDFVQEVNLNIWANMHDFNPVKISVKTPQSAGAFWKLSATSGLLPGNISSLLETEEQRINDNLGVNGYGIAQAEQTIQNINQNPALAGYETKLYISTLPAFFNQWMLRTLEKFTCELKGISPNDRNRLRRRRQGKSNEKTRKTNFMLDQLENREPNIPIQNFDSKEVDNQEHIQAMPVPLTAISAEEQFFMDQRSCYDSVLDELFEDMHIKHLATSLKKKLILKHQLELLTSEPLDMALEIMQTKTASMN